MTRLPSVLMLRGIQTVPPLFLSIPRTYQDLVAPCKIIEPSRGNITPENERSPSCCTFQVLTRPAAVKQPIMLISKRNPANTSTSGMSARGISLKQSLILPVYLVGGYGCYGHQVIPAMMIRLLNLKGDGAMHQRVAFIDNQFCSSLKEKENINNAHIYVQRYRN